MIWLFAAAVASGALSGMGIGGGVILIPVLTGIFGMDQHSAQYINLMYFMPAAVCALIVHAKNKRLNFKCALYMILGGVIASYAGSFAAMHISVKLLKKLFGCFLLAVGFSQLKAKKIK